MQVNQREMESILSILMVQWPKEICGGWTLVMFAESSAGGTSILTNQAYQVSNCANNTGFCKFSDSVNNADVKFIHG